MVIFPLILRAGYFYNGDRFLSELYNKLGVISDPVILSKLTDSIEEVLPKRNKKERPVIRLMGKDGIFRDVFGEKA